MRRRSGSRRTEPWAARSSASSAIHSALEGADERVVESVEFETDHPELRGEMTITTTLSDADGGTEILAVHEGAPPGLAAADNEAGWREALAKLAALVEFG